MDALGSRSGDSRLSTGSERREWPGHALAFADDFDSIALDLNKWSVWCPERHSQQAVHLRTGHSTVTITTRTDAEEEAGRAGRILSRQSLRTRFFARHGYFEVRAKALLGANHSATVCLTDSEHTTEEPNDICIAELRGSDSPASGTIMGFGFRAGRNQGLRELHECRLPLRASEFHTYAVEWSPAAIDYYVDDMLLKRLHQSPPRAMSLVMTLSELPLPRTALPVQPALSIDYVRVWQRAFMHA